MDNNDNIRNDFLQTDSSDVHDSVSSDGPFASSRSVISGNDSIDNSSPAGFLIFSAHSESITLNYSMAQSIHVPSTPASADRGNSVFSGPGRCTRQRRNDANDRLTSVVPTQPGRPDVDGTFFGLANASSNALFSLRGAERSSVHLNCKTDTMDPVTFSPPPLAAANGTGVDPYTSADITTLLHTPDACTSAIKRVSPNDSDVVASVSQCETLGVNDGGSRNETATSLSNRQSPLGPNSNCHRKSVVFSSNSDCDVKSNIASPDCPVCLLPSTYPVRLPCSHVFCFLCAKGSGSRCALCRADVPRYFWRRPHLLESTAAALSSSIGSGCSSSVDDADGFSWFYEGNGGWWQYDINACRQLEEALATGCEECRLLLAGHVYLVDLRRMTQQRAGTIGSRCRRVKRDLTTAAKKGVAGLYLPSN